MLPNWPKHLYAHVGVAAADALPAHALARRVVSSRLLLLQLRYKLGARHLAATASKVVGLAASQWLSLVQPILRGPYRRHLAYFFGKPTAVMTGAELVAGELEAGGGLGARDFGLDLGAAACAAFSAVAGVGVC